jgi:hypothetical protein
VKVITSGRETLLPVGEIPEREDPAERKGRTVGLQFFAALSLEGAD